MTLRVRVKKGQIGNFDPFGVEIAKTDIFPEISVKNYPGGQIFRILPLAVSPRPVGIVDGGVEIYIVITSLTVGQCKFIILN